MKTASINGRLSISTPRGWIDVAGASDGRFDSDPQDIYANWSEFSAWFASADTQSAPIVAISDDTNWDAPAPRPAQVFAIGLNYRDHAEESNLAFPTVPVVFTKFPSCIIGHDTDVVLPDGSVDWEVELVVVIGERADNIAATPAAWDHVAGLTIGQDLSERELQLTGPAPQFSLGKSHRGFGPTGPVLVTPDEFADPDDLEIGCALAGGEVLQKSRTRELIFSVPELIAHLSSVCPLLPGDLIFTGTPAGVGGARNPKMFLNPGDVLVNWVEGIGELSNRMVAQPN